MDRRPGARTAARGQRAARSRVDRRAGRPGRGRLRGVPPPGQARDQAPELEGLRLVDGVPRRHVRRTADRVRRGAGLRLRREVAHGRARARRVGGSGTRGPPRRRSRALARALQRRVLGRRRRLLRSRPRSRQAPDRRRRLEHGPPVVERHRHARADGAGGRDAAGDGRQPSARRSSTRPLRARRRGRGHTRAPAASAARSRTGTRSAGSVRRRASCRSGPKGSCSASSMRSAASGRFASRRAASSSIDSTQRDDDRRRAVCRWAVSGASCRRCRSACSRRSRARSGSAPRRSA